MERSPGNHVVAAVVAGVDTLLMVYVMSAGWTGFSWFDRVFVATMVAAHAIFFWAIIPPRALRTLRVLHVLLFVYFAAALWCDSVALRRLALALVLLVQVLWITLKRCILDDNDDDATEGWFGYHKLLRLYALSVTVALASRAAVSSGCND